MRQPTRFTLEKATGLGRLMGMTEPRLVPDLRNAHQYPSYVAFLQAHRHGLEYHAAFAQWDSRLNALIDSEGKMLGFVLSDRDDWDELAVSIATPIRCAFWYGWETVHNVKVKYEQHVREAARVRDNGIQILHVFNAPETPKTTQETPAEETDVLWDKVASNMLASLGSADMPSVPQPTPKSPSP